MASLNRPRWVIAELDVRGSIDEHAAMCLRHGLEGALDAGPAEIVVDLRDLDCVDAAGLELLEDMWVACLARGADLELLLPARGQDDLLAGPLVTARLLDSDICLRSGLRAQALKVSPQESDDQIRGVPLEHRSHRAQRSRSAH